VNFYTNVQCLRSKILFRGIVNGSKVQRELDYGPTLFHGSSVPSEYTTVRGEYMAPISFRDIKEAKDYINRYKDVSNWPIYGQTRFEYCYISDTYPGEIRWDRKKINVCNIDIEVGSENGFPEPEDANEPVTAITYKMNDKIVALGCGGFSHNRPDVTYIQCRDETHLLKIFLDYWCSNYPDVVTGWNIDGFDVIYLVNRITKILGEREAKRLSPWNIILDRKIESSSPMKINGEYQIRYKLIGIAIIDYQDAFKKFILMGKSRDSMKLNDICQEEIGEGKLSYEEYGNLHNLYRDNYQKFIEYNIRDVELVDKLDDHHKLIDLILTLSYDNKCNYEDAFQQVRMWDVICYNKLKARKQVVPPLNRREKGDYPGAYVKEPQPGKYKYVVSFDLNSLYPSLVRQYNISPDKFVEPEEYTPALRDFLSNNVVSVESMLNKEHDLAFLKAEGVTLTPNGQFFRTDSRGFAAELMKDMYDARNQYKKQMKEAKKLLINEEDPIKKADFESEVARCSNLQLAKKVSLNSYYGGTGNQYFRFFDVRQASAITTSGQLSALWIQTKINAYLNKVLGTEKDYVIASDTDSVYICLDELVSRAFIDLRPNATETEIIDFMDKVCEDKLSPFIDKSYRELAEYTNALDHVMEMKREFLCDSGLWTAKKRYALSVWDIEGLRYKEPQIKVTGLEVVRSTTPLICRDWLKEAIKVALHKSEKDMFAFIDRVYDEFMQKPFTEISIPRGAHGMEVYRTEGKWLSKTPAHIKAAMTFNRMVDKMKLGKKYPKIKNGEKVKLLYLRMPNPTHNEMIAYSTVLPPEFDVVKYIDWERHFEATFKKPLRGILNAIGWKEEEVNSLSKYMVKEDVEDE
jgi:DNA polymerase elongation subunit (family B)